MSDDKPKYVIGTGISYLDEGVVYEVDWWSKTGKPAVNGWCLALQNYDPIDLDAPCPYEPGDKVRVVAGDEEGRAMWFDASRGFTPSLIEVVRGDVAVVERVYPDGNMDVAPHREDTTVHHTLVELVEEVNEPEATEDDTVSEKPKYVVGTGKVPGFGEGVVFKVDQWEASGHALIGDWHLAHDAYEPIDLDAPCPYEPGDKVRVVAGDEEGRAMYSMRGDLVFEAPFSVGDIGVVEEGADEDGDLFVSAEVDGDAVLFTVHHTLVERVEEESEGEQCGELIHYKVDSVTSKRYAELTPPDFDEEDSTDDAAKAETRTRLVDGYPADWTHDGHYWRATIYIFDGQPVDVVVDREYGGAWHGSIEVGPTTILPSAHAAYDQPGPYEAAKALAPHAERLKECFEAMEAYDE